MTDDAIARAERGEHDDELLHVYECAWILTGHPEYRRCGYIAGSPGNCPYDHGEDVPLVEVTAVVLCSDCGEQIMRNDSRGDDGRLLCGSCVMSELASEEPR